MEKSSLKNQTYQAFIILMFSLLASASCSAQSVATSGKDAVKPKNSILISPFGLMAGNYNKIRIRVQHNTKQFCAYGADFKYFFPKEYPGFQVAPFFKFFPAKINDKGVYVYVT